MSRARGRPAPKGKREEVLFHCKPGILPQEQQQDVLSSDRVGCLPLDQRQGGAEAVATVALSVAFVFGKVGTADSSSVSSSSAGDVMRALLQLAIHEGMSEEEILSYSTAAFELVQDLRKDVCVDLLVAWLMGLIAKDASVIVSLQPMRPMAEADDSEVALFSMTDTAIL